MFYPVLFYNTHPFGTLLWIFVILTIIWALRYGSHHHHHHSPHLTGHHDMTALNTLNHRYAKGEIDKQEYEQKKKDILSS
jgi:putative membrane protein